MGSQPDPIQFVGGRAEPEKEQLRGRESAACEQADPKSDEVAAGDLEGGGGEPGHHQGRHDQRSDRPPAGGGPGLDRPEAFAPRRVRQDPIGPRPVGRPPHGRFTGEESPHRRSQRDPPLGGRSVGGGTKGDHCEADHERERGQSPSHLADLTCDLVVEKDGEQRVDAQAQQAQPDHPLGGEPAEWLVLGDRVPGPPSHFGPQLVEHAGATQRGPGRVT